MGEAKRKAEAAERARPLKKSWLKGLALLGPVIMISLVTAVAVIKTEPQTPSVQPARETDSDPAPVQTDSRRTVVINTPEGFADLARRYEASDDSFDWQQAVTYWKSVISRDRNNIEAWRGYARNSIRLLLHKNSMQPGQPLPHRWLEDASVATSQYLQLARHDPLAHELAAYEAAFRGGQQAALMHANNAMAHAARLGIPGDARHDVMTNVIIISSQRRNQGVFDPGRLPDGPVIPGVPFPR